MGHDVHVDKLAPTGHAPLNRAVFLDVILRGMCFPTFNDAGVEYPDGSHGEIYGMDDEGSPGFMITHFGGRTMLERLFEIADREACCIVNGSAEPDFQNCVTRAEYLDLRPDYLEDEIFTICPDAKSLADFLGYDFD